MDRYTVLSELKKYVNNTEETMKGTAVSTLNKDIFDMPNVNKTTELHQMKVGKSIVNIPIVKEEKVSDKIDDATLSLLLSKIKNAGDRDIVKEYIRQQNIQDIKNVVAKKPILESKVLEGEEDYAKTKSDIQEKLRAVKTRQDLDKIIDDDKINDFREELKSKGLKSLMSGLTKTLNATKDRINLAEAKVTQASLKVEEQARKKAEEARLKTEIREEQTRRNAEARAEETRLKAQARAEAKPKPVPKPRQPTKKEVKEEQDKENLKEMLEMKRQDEEMAKAEAKAEGQGADKFVIKKIGKKIYPYLNKGEKRPQTASEAKEMYGWTDTAFKNWRQESAQYTKK